VRRLLRWRHHDSSPRYTFFIIAYPAGVTGELLASFAAMLYSAWPKLLLPLLPSSLALPGVCFPHPLPVSGSENDLLSVHMPNTLNVTFSFPLIILGIMLCYIPLFPPMYLHMFTQRKKVLGAPKQD
jgi:very-long-chain (3R)-3-hydroxyacyl-CoA dehydratase